MKKILSILVFATIWFNANAQQFGDWEIVCWDSAGVVTPLLVRASTGNSSGSLIRTFYRLERGTSALNGKKVVPTVGTIEDCGTSSGNAIADSLGQLINNTTEPQQCQCEYAIDLHDQTLTVDTNALQPVWNYTQVVTRDCGAGPEVVASIPTATLTPKVWHNVIATSLTNTSAIIDSLRVSYGTTSHFNIYLSPVGVKTRYPALAIDTSLLRYNTANATATATALKTVIEYGINKWALDNGRAVPQRECEVAVNTGINSIFFQFNIINNPSSDYINLVNGATRVWYHRTESGSSTTTSAMGYAGSSQNVTHTYTTPCGLVASVSYQCNVNNSADVQTSFDVIPLISPLDTNRFGYVTRICSEPCPEGGGCVTICNDEDNPIPVTIITSPTDCPLTGVVEFPLSVSAISSTLPGNLYHSITISITSGTVILSAVNTSGTTLATFTSGQVFSAQAADCELIPTSFTVNATSGAATVATSK